MKRVPCLCVLVATVILAITSQAHAQYTEEDSSGKFSIYAGAYAPVGSDLQRSDAAVWKAFGLSLNTQMDVDDRPIASLGLDYAASESRSFKGSSLGMNYTRYFRGPAGEEGTLHGFYYGLGAGFNYNHAQMAPGIEEPPTPAVDESGIQYGVTALAGYDFSPDFYAELRYTQTTELAHDINFSGVSLVVGTRSLF